MRMLGALVIAVLAQAQQPAVPSNDPRVGLKAGYHDAGQAARNMELVATTGKPEGFYDPADPAGTPLPSETPAAPSGAASAAPAPPAAPTPPPASTPPANRPAPPASILAFGNSDMAFRGHTLFLGNFNGFNIYDIEDPHHPKLVTSVVCPGGQGDMSVHGNLLFMSVEETRGRVDCGTQGVSEPLSKDRFRGVRVFDISDLTKPKQVAAVQTCRGSHTHTLVIDPKDKDNIYVYGSGTSLVRSGDELAGCSSKDPKDDPETALFSIDVIQVPLAAPQDARVVNRPRIFADPSTGAIAGLWPGGQHGPGTQTTSVTNQCHDITIFPALMLAAGACSGNGILLDVADPVHPKRLDQVADANFAYWHSATFSNDGTKVVFTDEWGGGVRPRCRATDLPNWGADAIFSIQDRKLHFEGYYKMPAPQTDTENCVAHNGAIVPVPGRDIMAQGWYQGGVSVFDFTDPAKPVEIAYFDRGPIDAQKLYIGGFWAAYWYNGSIYASEISRGFDVFRLTPSEFLSQNEIDAANLVHLDEFNPQFQEPVTWPSNVVIARAYLDQLTRSHAIAADRASAIKAALDSAGTARPSGGAGRQLDALTSQLEKDAASAKGVDALRLRGLASALRGR